jgi:cytochrome bd-type quinol oxidase subunit 2
MFYLTSIGLGVIFGGFVLYMKEKLTKRQKDKLKRTASRYLDIVVPFFLWAGIGWVAIQMLHGCVHYTMNADEIAAQYTPQYMRYVEREYRVE